MFLYNHGLNRIRDLGRGQRADQKSKISRLKWRLLYGSFCESSESRFLNEERLLGLVFNFVNDNQKVKLIVQLQTVVNHDPRVKFFQKDRAAKKDLSEEQNNRLTLESFLS